MGSIIDTKDLGSDGAMNGVLIQFRAENEFREVWQIKKWFKIKEASLVGA